MDGRNTVPPVICLPACQGHVKVVNNPFKMEFRKPPGFFLQSPSLLYNSSCIKNMKRTTKATGSQNLNQVEVRLVQESEAGRWN